MKYLFLASNIVYTKKRYRWITILVSFFILYIAIFLPQKRLLMTVFREDSFTVLGKLKIFLLTAGTFITNFSFFSQITTIIIAILSGIIISFAGYYTTRQIRSRFATGTSTLGIILGLFGIGCSACGSVLLSSVIGISSTVNILGVLPFQGKEFTLLSIFLLAFSLWFVAKKIAIPPVCSIKKPT